LNQAAALYSFQPFGDNTMAKTTLKPIAALGAAAVLSSLAAPALAGQNPFAAVELSSGYAVAGKAAEGSCGEGKCGGDKAKPEGKCGEGNCGGDKATEEGKCGEGKCGGDGGEKAAGEGKCGEGKCGG
jgi:uncharacterized low-complexity protein